MVKLDVITTRGGDAGETSLGDGSRIRKDALRIEAMGAVDEANAGLGLVRGGTAGLAEGRGAVGEANAARGLLRVRTAGLAEDAALARIQNDLFDLGADLCVPGE